MKSEKIIEDHLLFSGKVFDVHSIKVQMEDGGIENWEVVEKHADSVAIVAIDAESRVHLIEEYFGAVDQRLLCLPKGTISAGESPSCAALRELQEEIGFTGSLRLMAKVQISPSYLRQQTWIFLATELTPSRLQGDEREFIVERVFPLEQVEAMIVDGSISEARTIAGILLAKKILGIP